MSSQTRIQTVSSKTSISTQEEEPQYNIESGDIDKLLKNVVKHDNRCYYTRCKNNIINFAITCQFCQKRFCPTHSLPEIHGCGEAVKREEKRKFLHPNPKLPQAEHTKAAEKLSAKLKDMQFQRKAKQGSTKNKK